SRPLRRGLTVPGNLLVPGKEPRRLQGGPGPRVEAQGPRGEPCRVRCPRSPALARDGRPGCRLGRQPAGCPAGGGAMSLRQQVAVVSGAASGMGRALCRELAQAGMRLGLVDCNATGLSSLAEELTTAQTRCAAAVADVRDRQAVRGAVDFLTDRLGP